MAEVTIDRSNREDLLRRGVRLEFATLGWNVLEIGFLFWAALAARSVALAAFAIDSGIEIFASIIVIRELRGDIDPVREQVAVRRIGIAFLALAVFIACQSVATIVLGIRPDPSPFGIAWLSATGVVMFVLAWAKHRTGTLLEHRVLLTEAKVTIADGALATGVLAGLVLNATLGWWWADIAAGLIVVAYGVREGFLALVPSSGRQGG